MTITNYFGLDILNCEALYLGEVAFPIPKGSLIDILRWSPNIDIMDLGWRRDLHFTEYHHDPTYTTLSPRFLAMRPSGLLFGDSPLRVWGLDSHQEGGCFDIIQSHKQLSHLLKESVADIHEGHYLPTWLLSQ